MTHALPAATVYLATNLANGKTYVGVTKRSLTTRWSAHVWTALNKAKTYFHRAIAKYGPESFKVEPIASCLSVESAVATERLLIQQWRPDYNQTNGGEFTIGKHASKEAIARIAAANRGKRRTPAMKAANSELKKAQWASKSAEARAADVAALKVARASVNEEKRLEAVKESHRGRQWSPESRAKLSASCMGRRHPREVLDRMAATKNKAVVCVETGERFKSVSEAASAVGLDIGTISRVCRGIRPTAGGMRFTFEREL